MYRELKSLTTAQNNRQKVIDRISDQLREKIDIDFVIVENNDQWFVSVDLGMGHDLEAPLPEVLDKIKIHGFIDTTMFFDIIYPD